MRLANFALLVGLAITPAVALAQDRAPAQDRPQPSGDDAAGAAAGQPQSQGQTADEKKPPTPPHTGIRALFTGLGDDFKHLPSAENAYLALMGGGLAIGAHPFDQTFNAHLRSHYDEVNTAFAPGKYLGDTPEQVGLSIGTYAFGRLFNEPKVSHLGMDLLRAQIVNETMVQTLKFATHRERPDGSNHQSFPSGHAAVTFAGATVLERHLGWKNSVLAYAVASYVAASRLHDNRHYLSEVAFGAAVGTISGRTVTQHGRTNWTLAPVSVPGGVAVMAMKTR